MRKGLLLAIFLLCGCSKESDRLKKELDIIRSTQEKLSGGREADNAQLCDAYTRLQKAYLAEENTDDYAKTQLFVVAYC